ncbi:Putative Spherulation-specific family 4 [Septoria linicola]|uniref:Spherulation-specific family 4 n=1 Tax=Septoria linicola TaxID=215465 RepID=A0A9Q9EGH6_9PEZI|nr:putative Spherulation-specific family 4 [Septoria linicola]USW48929.1 Putative Spherulation-specific family 4 [Septoria linicola]
MEAPRFVLGRQRQKSKRLCWTAGIVTLCVLILIIVPTAVVVSRNKREYPDGVPAKVLIPLYEYPETPYAWDPLYEAINSTTDLDFVVIINPDSGPGSKDSSPPADFVPQIQKLNSLPNVQTVGYDVGTGYGSRPVGEIVRDIETYSSWSSMNDSLAMHGVFFDEAVYKYSEDNFQHLSSINAFAKNSTGIREPHTVIHNPGVVPDTRLNFNTTDITVIFEESLKKYRKLQNSLQEWPLDRANTAYMVHSAASAELKQLVPEMSYRAKHLFVTNNKMDFYGSFGSDWQKFVAAVPTNNTTAT